MVQKKYQIYALAAVILAASISALGTIPYAFQFAQRLQTTSYLLALVLGLILAFSAAFANAILGIYSFLNIQTAETIRKPAYLIIISLSSAVPVGCMCYFAYHTLLPWIINMGMTISVTLINAAIGYTAMLNLVTELKSGQSYTDSLGESICRMGGFIVGTVVSLAAYMAAIHGLTQVFSMGFLSERLAFQLACAVGFLTWLPFAALFANAMQKSAGKIYYFVCHFSKDSDMVSRKDILLLLIAFCSGASFAQIAITFFNPEMKIPEIFKALPMQGFIYSVLVPMAFISSSAVNYLALNNILKIMGGRTKS